MKKICVWLGMLVTLAVVAGVAAAIMVWVWFVTPATHENPAIVEIAPKTGFTEITNLLAEAGVIDYPLFFKMAVVVQQQQANFKAGEYEFDENVSPQAVMEKLVKGDSIIHAITLPEGLTSAQMVTMVAQDPRFTGSVPEGVGEGTLMPDTYHFHRGDSRAAVVQRMQEAMDKALAEAWKKRADDLPFTTAREALILASVVERETGVKDERPRVAAVFVNRLRSGMPLQSDPTVVYGIERKSGAMNRALIRNDLKIDHPYNTYVHGGLPAGPIANPGRASIEAAINPPATDEYYFVATGTGGHHFSKTLAEHNRYVAQYRAVLRAQQKP